MKQTNLNVKLITAIQDALPQNQNMASALMDILLIGKESIYRRLRGEVPFTFEEIAKIADELKFSVDNVIGINNGEKTVFNINLLNPQTRIEDYASKLECFIHMFRKMKKSPNSQSRYALNTLPYCLYFNHFNLSKFKYYRWIYQTNAHVPYIDYKKLDIPPLIDELQKTFVAEYRYIKRSVIILDRNVFPSMINDIEYFYELNLIQKEDVDLLRTELLELLNDLESVAISGKFKTGSDVFMYLSNVDIEAFYCHFEYDEYQYSHLRVYGINGIDSESEFVCKVQKEWIDSMKRYSTLISQSGELQRHEYFKLQREQVTNMGY